MCICFVLPTGRAGRVSKHFRKEPREEENMPEEPDELFYTELRFAMHEDEVNGKTLVS